MTKTLGELFKATAHNASLVKFTSDGRADYSDTPPAGYVRLEGKIFELGDYPQKKFSLNEAEADAAIEQFVPVPADLEHMPTILDGKLGLLRTIWREGKSVFGAADVPEWVAGALRDTKSTVSCAWDRATKTLQGWGWVLEPAVSDATLVSSFAAFAVADPEAARLDVTSILAGATVGTSGGTAKSPVLAPTDALRARQPVAGSPDHRRLRMPLIDQLKQRLSKSGAANGVVMFHDPNAPGQGMQMGGGGGGGQGQGQGQQQQGQNQNQGNQNQQAQGALAGVASGDPVEVQQDDGTWRGGYVACAPVSTGTGPNDGQQTIQVCSSADFQAGQQANGTEVPADKVRAVHPGHQQQPNPQSQQGGGGGGGQGSGNQPPPSFNLYAPGTKPQGSDKADDKAKLDGLARFSADRVYARSEEAAKAIVKDHRLYRFGQEALTALFMQMDFEDETGEEPLVTFSRADGSVVRDRVSLLKEIFGAVPQSTALFSEGLPIHVLNGNQGRAEEDDSPQAQGTAQAAEFNAGMQKNMPALKDVVIANLPVRKGSMNGHSNGNGNGAKP